MLGRTSGLAYEPRSRGHSRPGELNLFYFFRLFPSDPPGLIFEIYSCTLVELNIRMSLTSLLMCIRSQVALRGTWAVRGAVLVYCSVFLYLELELVDCDACG